MIADGGHGPHVAQPRGTVSRVVEKGCSFRDVGQLLRGIVAGSGDAQRHWIRPHPVKLPMKRLGRAVVQTGKLPLLEHDLQGRLAGFLRPVADDLGNCRHPDFALALRLRHQDSGHDLLPVCGLRLCGSGNHRQQGDQHCGDHHPAPVSVEVEVRTQLRVGCTEVALTEAPRCHSKPYGCRLVHQYPLSFRGVARNGVKPYLRLPPHRASASLVADGL